MADNNTALSKKETKELKKKQQEAEKAAKMAKFLAKKEAVAQKTAAATEKKEPKTKPVKAKDKPQEDSYVDTTPPGEKKDMSKPMLPAYNPPAVEAAWYDWWTAKGFFKANNKTVKEKFVIVIPPPNVTGMLHLGHALTNSVQDAITRWHRMNGKEALWVPGTDHAGIATQVVVEKKLMKERNLSRHDLGREKFIEEVWKWKNEYGGGIVSQLKRLGSSLDWDREVFTMDEKLSRAVTEAFVRCFDEGLIYRDNRLVNWCCKLNTAISDIEVDHLKLEKHTKLKVPGHDKEYDFGIIVDFAYKVAGEDAEIVVSTTRPETMLGDTAVAVHPDDPRYKHLHGKVLIHPFVDRKIPIITDSTLVNMEFGTGAVKVTPAHDPNDYQCGKRNKLEFLNIFNDNGTINANGGQFKGMKRFDARDAVISALKEKGLYRGMKDNPMALGICSRSKDIIEPMMKPQWWVNCKGMADAAIKAAESGTLAILPPNHKDTWYRWLSNIQEWCISRQLWWGHRCPAYLPVIEGEPKLSGKNNSDWIVARSEKEAMEKAKAKYPHVPPHKIKLEQDPDVLDTWFSSALFPFSVFGWPDNTEDLQAFYPTSLLETGHDILFFWVARMVMMGIQLTGKLPFSQVFLHAMVRDAHGRKMSKSSGNVIDPVDMITGISLEGLHAKLESGNLDPKEIEKAIEGQKQDYPKGIPECGTDAMRFALCAYTSQGRDINLDVNRVAAYRNFCNKLWNATKFALINLGDNYKPAATQPAKGGSPWEDWILSRLNYAIIQANEGFKKYDFAQTTSAIYNFWLYELCDVYLESMKPIVQAATPDTRKLASSRETLYTCLDNGLRLLHPFMPFVTEELYQRLNRRESEVYESICIAAYPKEVHSWVNEQIEKEVKFSQDIIKAVRVMRASFNLTKERPKIYVNLHNEQLQKMILPYKEGITFLSNSEAAEIVVNQSTPAGCAVEIVNENCEVYLMIKGLVDIAAELDKLEKKKTKTEVDYDKLLKQTQGPNYHKVPDKLKQENTEKLSTLHQEIVTAEKAIASFKKFM